MNYLARSVGRLDMQAPGELGIMVEKQLQSASKALDWD
jgi:hypothetical protein